MSKPDGGPVYPRTKLITYKGVVTDIDEVPGMSVRTWLTGQALTGLCADPRLDITPTESARVAIEHADAALAELERTGGGG